MGGIIAYLVLGIPIFTNIYDDLKPAELAQFISNYSFKCQYLIYLFTRLYNTLDDISNIAGNSYRIGELFDKMNSNSNQPKKNKAEQPTNDILLNPSVCFIVENLNIEVPDKSKTLIRNLSFTFARGRNVLVTGRSGCGKTSLLRCLNGLWTSYSGKLLVNNYEKFFFLPQSSYFTSGSLLEQIIYPRIEEQLLNVADEEILYSIKVKIQKWLRMFNLEHLLTKVKNDFISKPSFNWSSILSAGRNLNQKTFSK